MEGNQQLLALEIEHLTRRVGNSAVAVALELLPEGDGLGAAVEVNEGTGAVVVDPGAAMAGVEGGIEQGEGGGGLAPLPQLDGGFQLAVQGGVEQGLGLLFVTHALSVASGCRHRVIVLDGGRIVEEGPGARLLIHPQAAITRTLVEACPRLPVLA